MAGQTVVVTLGITIDGTKVPLGIWLGSTENSRVCTAMLQDLLDRGLRVDESILCVVDGGKGIRKALVDVLGDLAVIQRCQIHKLRNLRSYLPKSRHAYVLQTMKEAYKSKSADKARKKLRALVSWLERNGYDEAAGSLREGMEETLTVVKLALPESLRKSLATTNSIEQRNHPQSIEKRQALEESFHDSPMDRFGSSPEKKLPAYQRLSRIIAPALVQRP